MVDCWGPDRGLGLGEPAGSKTLAELADRPMALRVVAPTEGNAALLCRPTAVRWRVDDVLDRLDREERIR
jgi:hypothetical protein